MIINAGVKTTETVKILNGFNLYPEEVFKEALEKKKEKKNNCQLNKKMLSGCF